MKKRLLAIALCLLTLMPQIQAQSPKREFRSIWLATVSAIDWPSRRGTTAAVRQAQQKEMAEYLDGFAGSNINGVCFQVRSMCDAMYKSSYEPWSTYVSGTRGADPGWDPLAWVVEECHKRGLECYAWVNPFRWSSSSYSTTVKNNTTPADKSFIDKGWILHNDSYCVLNPAIAGAREHIKKVCDEIMTNYKVDGMIFDDYFYPSGGLPETSAAGDWDLYKSSGSKLSFGDWRRENVNSLIKELYDMIQQERPDMRFGISPAGVAGASASRYGLSRPPVSASDWQYNQIYSDPLAWLDEGSIDFISPQIYWKTNHSTAPYEPLTKWWSEVADHFGRHHYASHSISFMNSDNTPSAWREVVTQINHNRKYATSNSAGSIYFSAKYINGPAVSGFGDHLKANAYQNKALVPALTWKEHRNYNAPADVRLSGSTLTWSPVPDAGNAIIRYTVYAVPVSVSMDRARDAEGDGIDGKYLVDISYSPSLAIPADKATGHWYAVCVYDGYGFESMPGTFGYPEGTSAKVTLTSPVGGARVGWDAAFSWSALPGATFTLQISESSSFASIALAEDDIRTNSTVIDLGALKENTTYHWRVVSREPNKLETLSDVASFTSPVRTPAPATTLLEPADGIDAGESILFKWTAVPEAESYTLQISTDPSFGSILTYRNVESTSYSLISSLLGKGTFYWRVVTDGSRFTPTASSSRSFTVSTITVGALEPGYVIKTDPATYSREYNCDITNLWMRSIKSGFSNITFQDNGLMNRGLAAKGDYVYVSGRTEGSSSADIYLSEYSAATGEHVRDIKLGDEGKVNFYPCNDLIKDAAGDLFISNLVLNVATTPIKLHRVNLVDGSLTEVASLTTDKTATARVDHVSIDGNVGSGNFAVLAAMSSGTQVVRWTISDGKVTDCTVRKLSSFCPASSQHFGVSPRVLALPGNEILTNGGSTAPARYSYATGRMLESIDSNASMNINGYLTNGIAVAQANSLNFMVYTTDDHGSASGYRYGVYAARNSDKLKDMHLLWTLPQGGLGNLNSSTGSSPCDIVDHGDGTLRLYLLAAGNGLAAYHINDTATGVSDITADGRRFGYTINGRNIVLGATAGRVQLVNMSGVTVVSAPDTDRITAPAAGVYILVADHNSALIVVK